MGERQIKRLRKHCNSQGLSPEATTDLYQKLKKSKKIRWMFNNVSRRPIIVQKKRHPGEPLDDFQRRRFECNRRRRQKEKTA